MNGIELILDWAGTASELARRLGISHAAVAKWKRTGTVPPERAIQIERLSDGKLKAVEICADEGKAA